MKIQSTAVAGTLESSDIMITVEPGEAGIQIELDSTVEKQFGQTIRRVIAQTLEELGVDNAQVVAVDRGALDCAIRARVRTAVLRASGEAHFDWQAVVE